MVQNKLSEQAPAKKVQQFFKAIADDDRALARQMLTADATLASAIGLEWRDYWHGDAAAIHVAVMHRHKEMVELLLEYGADVNQREDNNWTVRTVVVALLRDH